MNTTRPLTTIKLVAVATALHLIPLHLLADTSTTNALANPVGQSTPSRTPTPEEKAIIDAYIAIPPDHPSPKIDTNILDKSGKPNAGFAKTNGRFLAKHEEFLKRAKSGPIGILFLGDSITEGWLRGSGPLWKGYEDKYQAADFGISGDKTQHVLWRIENGELDGIDPKLVILMIGTNNNKDTAEAILRGDLKIVESIHAKLPHAKLLVLGIFPRGKDPADPKVKELREKLATVNAGLAKLDDGKQTRYLYFGEKFMNPDGKIPADIMPDGLHPNAKGYEIWAAAMQPTLDQMLQ